MKILVTAIGSMSAECVIMGFVRLGHEVVGTDIFPREYHPISRACKAFFMVPKAGDEPDEYLLRILEVAVKNSCDAIVPLTDPEVDVISPNRASFEREGIMVWLSDDQSVLNARAKEKWATIVGTLNAVKLIPTFTSYDVFKTSYSGDFVAKRINGRSSEGILFSNTKEFSVPSYMKSGYMFQPKLHGSVITVDFARHPISRQLVVMPRQELLRTKNGAGTVVKMLNPDGFVEAVTELTTCLNLNGVMNCEFLQIENNKLYLMDINPRFSAGVSFSYMAGHDFPLFDICSWTDSCYPNYKCNNKVGAVYAKRFTDYEVL